MILLQSFSVGLFRVLSLSKLRQSDPVNSLLFGPPVLRGLEFARVFWELSRVIPSRGSVVRSLINVKLGIVAMKAGIRLWSTCYWILNLFNVVVNIQSLRKRSWFNCTWIWNYTLFLDLKIKYKSWIIIYFRGRKKCKTAMFLITVKVFELNIRILQS